MNATQVISHSQVIIRTQVIKVSDAPRKAMQELFHRLLRHRDVDENIQTRLPFLSIVPNAP